MKWQNSFFRRLFFIGFCLVFPFDFVAQDKGFKKNTKKRKPAKKAKKTKKRTTKKSGQKKKRSFKKAQVKKNQPKEQESDLSMIAEQEIAAYIIDNLNQLQQLIDKPEEADALKKEIEVAIDELNKRQSAAQDTLKAAMAAELEAKTDEEKAMAVQQRQDAQKVVDAIQATFEAIKPAQEAVDKAFLEWELKKSAEELAKIEGKS